ncbi:MAG: transporter substrate-binding domain-containing protein [Acetobacteraceae bacterium]|jgi:polar amino acid transport system substrate-binding protein
MPVFHPLPCRFDRRKFLTALVAMGVGMPDISAATETLRIAYTSTYPPICFLDGGTMKGVLVDVFDELLGKRLGMTLSHQGLPWARAQDTVRDGGADAFCTDRTDQRAEYANFGDETVIAINYAVFYAKTNPKAADIQKIAALDDLKSFSQGDYLGNGFAETHFKSLKIDWAANIDQVFNKIIAGRNDITVAAEMVGKWTARKLGLTDQLGVQPVNFLPGANFRLAIRKNYEGNEALLHRFDEAMKAARTEGLLQTIEAKYT